MRPGTEPRPADCGQRSGDLCPNLDAEGVDYGAALLRRIEAGNSSPDDFATVAGFLQGDATFYGFACVMFEALRHALAPLPDDD